nr:hypothetical protein [Tanacetum cinerariifolium]
QSEESDSWKEVKIHVDVACDMGIPVSKDVISSWFIRVWFYDEEYTKRVKRNVILEEKLKTKISDLEAELVLLNRNLLVNAIMNAQRMVKDSEEATGEKVNGLYDDFFYQTYKAEILKVKNLQWEKSVMKLEGMKQTDILFTLKMDSGYGFWFCHIAFFYSDSSDDDVSVYSVFGSVQISSSAHYADVVGN